MNLAVPDYIGTEAGPIAIDEDIVVNRDALGPQSAAPLRWRLGVVLKSNRWRLVGAVE